MKLFNKLPAFLIGLCLVFLGYSLSKQVKNNNQNKITEKIIKEKKNSLKLIPDEFKPFVVDFWIDMEKRGFSHPEITSLQIYFGNTKRYKRHSVGFCSFQENAIVISKEFWEKSSLGSRQQLIDHELGHCVLQRLDEKHKDPQNPASVMNETVFNGEHYLRYKEIYRNELFRKETFGSYFRKYPYRSVKK